MVADFLEVQPHHTNFEQETSRSAWGCQRGLSRWGRGASGGPAARGPGQAGGGCTVAHQAPLAMEFSRQEYWSRLLFPPVGDLADQGIEPRSPALRRGPARGPGQRREPQVKSESLRLAGSCSGFPAGISTAGIKSLSL